MTTNDATGNEDDPFDRKAIEANAIAGAKALAQLRSKSHEDWDRWEQVILGLRGLRDLAKHATSGQKLTSQAYRDEIGRMLDLKKYEEYKQLSKQQRSACYQLMDRLDDVADWYHGRKSYQGYPCEANDRLNWKSPETIIKHCPPNFLNGGDVTKKKKKKQPESKPKKKKSIPSEHQAEIDRLRKLVLTLIELLIKHDPKATEYLKQLHPTDDDLNDDISELFQPENQE